MKMSRVPGIASGYDITQNISSLRGTGSDSYSLANCSVSQKNSGCSKAIGSEKKLKLSDY